MDGTWVYGPSPGAGPSNLPTPSTSPDVDVGDKLHSSVHGNRLLLKQSSQYPDTTYSLPQGEETEGTAGVGVLSEFPQSSPEAIPELQT